MFVYLSDIHGDYIYKMGRIASVRHFVDDDNITIFFEDKSIINFDYEDAAQALEAYNDLSAQLRGE